MAVSCAFIKNAETSEELKWFENQIMDRSSMWICAYRKRLELGEEVSLEEFKKFPEEFSEEIKALKEKKRQEQKEGFLEIKKRLKIVLWVLMI